MRSAESVLDVDTGGGEKLSDLLQAVGCPVRLSATEGWAPNVPIARGRLKPFGVEVVEADKAPLPFPDGSSELIINRHGLFEPGDYVRLLQCGGKVISQQVGSDTNRELVAAMAAVPGVNRELSQADRPKDARWDAPAAAALCASAGLAVEQALEHRYLNRYLDAGAICLVPEGYPVDRRGFLHRHPRRAPS